MSREVRAGAGILFFIGRFVVSGQKPEFVGAKQKRFAWMIGVVLTVLTLGIILFFTPNFLNFVNDNIEKDCTAPQFAIDLGHTEVWKKHNGCE